VLANRYGVEDRGGRRLQFTGCSQIVAPDGRVLESAPADQDALNVVEIEPEKADDKRVTGIDDLFIDRKPDLYHLS
jgi:predicted amidohydrolase